MVKAIKVMLIPNNVQKTKMFQYAGASRFAYNWAFCFIGCLNIRKDFAMSWEICSWSVSVMGITDSSLPRYTLLI